MVTLYILVESVQIWPKSFPLDVAALVLAGHEDEEEDEEGGDEELPVVAEDPLQP